MKYPVLKALNVAQPDLVEAISIPLQQVAKVVADGKEIPPEQKNLLEKVVDLTALSQSYKEYISDPVKILVRFREPYLLDHKSVFFKIWLDIGIRYPEEYIQAWIKQTRGFWHGGYNYWIWATGVQNTDWVNSMGIKQTIHSYWVTEMRDRYLSAFMNNKALMPLLSIGFHFWILIAFLCCNIINGRKVEVFTSIPCLAITLTLLIATPVFSEFRYAYATFICLPFISLCSIYFFKPKLCEK